MKHLITALFTALLLLPSVCCHAENNSEAATFTESGHTTDSLEVVRKRLNAKQAVLLDVREQDEWDAGHLKLAKLLPLSVIRKGELSKEQLKLLPKHMPIYCHCRSGGRTLTVSRLLREKGYDVRPLQAGYEKLLEADFKKADNVKDSGQNTE